MKYGTPARLARPDRLGRSPCRPGLSASQLPLMVELPPAFGDLAFVLTIPLHLALSELPLPFGHVAFEFVSPFLGVAAPLVLPFLEFTLTILAALKEVPLAIAAMSPAAIAASNLRVGRPERFAIFVGGVAEADPWSEVEPGFESGSGTFDARPSPPGVAISSLRRGD